MIRFSRLFSPTTLVAALLCQAHGIVLAGAEGAPRRQAGPVQAGVQASAQGAPAGQAVSVAPPAAGVTPPPTDEMPRVDVVGSQADARRDAVSFRHVVGAAELVRFGDASVLDVLRRQSGIVVSGVPGMRGGQISMRGMGSGYVRVLLDGEPAPPGFALDNLAPELVERIEIVPVANAELGTQAIAGSINVVLKRRTTRRQRELKLGVYHDARRTKPQASGSYGDQQGRWSWLVTGAARRLAGDESFTTRTEGYDAQGALSRRLAQFNQDRGWTWSLAPRLTFKPRGENVLTLHSFVSRNRFESAGYDRTSFLLGPVIPLANDTYTSNGDSFSARNNATWLQSVGEASTLELKVGTTHERRERGSTILFDDGGDRAASMQLLQFRDDSRASTANAKLKTSFADKHTVVMGIEMQDARDDAARANFLDAVSQLANIGTGFSIRTRRHAIYAQDEWDISPRWSLYLGARWERVALRSENDLGRRGESERAVFSPIVQTVWRLPGTKQDQVRLGLARTWRLPSGENLIAGRSVANVNAVTTPDTSGNPDLRAELAWGLDAAYEHYLGKQGMVSVSAFVRRIDDVVVTRTMQLDGRWLAMPVNEGSATSRGIEIELKGKLTQLVSGAPALDLRANLARSWSSIAAVPGPHNRIGRQAPLSLNLGVDYGVKAFPLTVGGAFGYVRNGEVRVSAFESGYHADNRNLEAYALWKLHPRANVRLSAANLLRRDDVQEGRYTGDDLALRKAVLSPTHGVVRAIMEFKL